MSSSNICDTFIARSNAQAKDDNPSMLHRPRTVYIGKEKYPSSLVPLEDIKNSALKKNRGFHQLETAVFSLTRMHRITDLIELVYAEIPIDKHPAAQDAIKKMQRVLVSVYGINSLRIYPFSSLLPVKKYS